MAYEKMASLGRVAGQGGSRPQGRIQAPLPAEGTARDRGRDRVYAHRQGADQSLLLIRLGRVRAGPS